MAATYKKMIRIYPVCLILMLILCAGIPLGAMAADTIKIGYLEAKSGVFESVGRFFEAGFQFAVDEQNEKGGLFGKKIEVLTEDSEFKPDVANRKAKKLVMEDKVHILASGGSSAVAVVMNKAATTYKMLYLNHGGMTDDIQGREFSRYGFRIVPNMHNHYAALALFMAKKPYRRFYIIGPDYLAAHSASKTFKEQIKIHVPDAQIVGEDYHPLGTTKDFGPYITKVIAAKADAVVAENFGPDLINMIKQGRAMGLKAPFPFLSHVLEPYPIYELKDEGVGLHIAAGYSLRVTTPENKEMIRKYHEKHKGDKDFQTWWPVGLQGAGVIGWRMTFAAIEKAGSLDPEKVIGAFEGFQYKSTMGLWTMRPCDHQVLAPMVGVAMEGGPNPFFNGSIRPEVKFPWEGPAIEVFPAEKVALPATSDYNSRCR
jgi:branched-chain amino acid transport system substrate-binding protein